MKGKSRIRFPAGAEGDFSSPEFTFCDLQTIVSPRPSSRPSCSKITSNIVIVVGWLIPRRRGFWGRLMISSCMLVGGCKVRFLMHTAYCTLDRRRFGADDDLDAARFFCLLRLSFAASCLSPSNLRLAFLTDERQLSRSEASCCHD